MADEKRVKLVCSHCGSENVLIDAYAKWDPSTQKFKLLSTFDKGHVCDDCGGPCSIKEVELADREHPERVEVTMRDGWAYSARGNVALRQEGNPDAWQYYILLEEEKRGARMILLDVAHSPDSYPSFCVGVVRMTERQLADMLIDDFALRSSTLFHSGGFLLRVTAFSLGRR
jgi:hypothetical protein